MRAPVDENSGLLVFCFCKQLHLTAKKYRVVRVASILSKEAGYRDLLNSLHWTSISMISADIIWDCHSKFKCWISFV